MKKKPEKKALPLPMDPAGWPDFSIENWPRVELDQRPVNFEPKAVDFTAGQ